MTWIRGMLSAEPAEDPGPRAPRSWAEVKTGAWAGFVLALGGSFIVCGAMLAMPDPRLQEDFGFARPALHRLWTGAAYGLTAGMVDETTDCGVPFGHVDMVPWLLEGAFRASLVNTLGAALLGALGGWMWSRARALVSGRGAISRR